MPDRVLFLQAGSAETKVKIQGTNIKGAKRLIYKYTKKTKASSQKTKVENSDEVIAYTYFSEKDASGFKIYFA